MLNGYARVRFATMQQPNSIGGQHEPPRARNTDPETSHEAAKSLGDLRPRQRAVVRVFERWGQLTDGELRHLYDGPAQSDSGLRTRRSELVALGVLFDTGSRRVTGSGRKSIVWGLV